MMIIRASTLKKTPWKNGGGLTTEIIRFGRDGRVGDPASGEDFSWRLSFAEIKTNTAFSIFSGYDRVLTVWEGNGIKLGGATLLPLTPFYFSGDLALEAKLTDGSVVDLGLIYRRTEWSAKMSVSAHVANLVANLVANETNLIFVIAGKLDINGGQAGARDTVVFDWSGSAADITTSRDFKAICITLTRCR